MISGIRVVLGRDLRTFFTDFYGIGFRTLELLLQTVIFAYVLTSVVPSSEIGGLTYLQFFALGSLITSVFWASYEIGRDVYWDRDSGYLNYLMALPLSRSEVVVGRMLGGSTRGIITVLPLFALAGILVPTSLVNIVESVGLLFTFAMGICGISITINLLLREEVRSRLLSTLLSLLLIRSSTALYPSVAMPVWLQMGTKLNPVTYAADAIRIITIQNSDAAFPLGSVSFVLLFTAAAALIGSWLFSKSVEGGPTQ